MAKQSTFEVEHFPVGSECWMRDMRGPVRVRVEKITFYDEGDRRRATHYVRPVDAPPEVRTHSTDIFWQWPETWLLFETEEEAKAAFREYIAEMRGLSR